MNHFLVEKVLLNTDPQKKVTIITTRHSRMLLAGIQEEGLDARLGGHEGCILDA
jgi:hypothetical protein